MKKIIIAALVLISFRASGQNDTTSVILTLKNQEAVSVYNYLGKQPAEEVEQLRPLIAQQLQGKLDSVQDVSMKLPLNAVQYIVNVVAGYPWKEVYQIMPKLFAAVSRKGKNALE